MTNMHELTIQTQIPVFISTEKKWFPQLQKLDDNNNAWSEQSSNCRGCTVCHGRMDARE